jgi:putative peptidoglycan lipid II flippase
MSQLSTSRGVARATLIIMFATALSALLGLMRQIVISAAFGAGRELDAFYAAARVPETLFVLVAGGALASAYIPVFTRLHAQSPRAAWDMASSLFSTVALAGGLLSALCFLLARPLVDFLLLPAAPAETQALAAYLMRPMLGTVAIFAVSGLSMATLNLQGDFLRPALAPAFYNLGIIFGGLALVPSWGVAGLAWGTLLGAGLHLGVQAPRLWALGRGNLRLHWQPRQAGVGEVFSLMLPRVLGLGVVQVNFWVNAALASDMPTGSLAALTTAFTLMFTVLGILGQSAGTAVFPALSRLSAEKDWGGFSTTLNETLERVLFLSLPAGLGLATVAPWLLAVLFQRGAWTEAHTQATAWALGLFAIGLAGHAVLEVLARAFYALHDTWTPVRVGVLTMLLNIGLSLLFVTLIGREARFERGAFGGLALAMSLATALESAVLWFLLRRRISWQDAPARHGALKIALCALLMAGALAAFGQISDGWPPAPRLLMGIGWGAGLFAGLAWLWRLPLMVDLAKRRWPR